MSNDTMLAARQAAHDALDAYDEAVDAALAGTEPEPPEPPVTGDPRFGEYAGSNAESHLSNVRELEDALHVTVDQVGTNQDQRWDGAGSSIYGIFGNPKGTMKLQQEGMDFITCAIQLAFDGGPYGATQGKITTAGKRKALQRTLDGEADEMYAKNISQMQKSQWPHMILRFGSEGDINWPPHSFIPGSDGGQGNDDLFRAVFQHVSALFKDAFGDRVRRNYTTTQFAGTQTMLCHGGGTKTKIEAGYPGDAHCDIIGCDAYLGSPLATVKTNVEACYAFAQDVGKPFSFDEWGITPGGFDQCSVDEQVAYVEWLGEFSHTHNVEYASFFAEWSESKWEDYPPAVKDAITDAWS